MKDKLEQEIKVGDWIAYGHALGRCAGIRIGWVLAIKENGNLTVQGINDDWSRLGVKLCDRKGTLQFPEERVIVLPVDSVPPRFRAFRPALA